MRISEREHTFESFINELVDTGVEPAERLRVVCYISNEGDWKAESIGVPSLISLLASNGVEVKDLGDMKKLVAHYRDVETSRLVAVTYFAFLHRETRLLMCFTNASKFDVYQTLDRIVERNPGLYYAFISPSTLLKIERMLLDANPGTFVRYFSARRRRQSTLKSEIRPEYERTIEYSGKDGKNVLEELKHAYGVSPRSIHFEIPDFAIYQIHNIGQLTVAKGESNARRFLLEIVDFAMKDTLLAKKTVESADFKLIPIETQRKILLFPKLKPWRIKFSSPLNLKEGESLIEILQESDFDVFNHVLAQGSLRLSGMVADRLKNTIFTVDANAERMVIAPLQEVTFDSFLRFYQVIVENFDPNAVCEVFE
jgi:hypothetical protein